MSVYGYSKQLDKTFYDNFASTTNFISYCVIKIYNIIGIVPDLDFINA